MAADRSVLAPPSTGGSARGDPFAPPHTGPDPNTDITADERVILRALYQRAQDHAEDEIGRKLERAYRYLDGKVDAEPAFHVGKDEQGRQSFHGSRTVVRECRDKLRAIVPELARIFLSSDEIVAFSPKSREDEEYAEQATEYCNYNAKALGGEERILDSFFDWLVKFCAIKVYWHEEITQEYQGFSGVEQAGMALLMQQAQDPDTNVMEVDAEPYREVIEVMDPRTGQRLQIPVVKYRGRHKTRTIKKSLKWELIRPDEFIIDPDCFDEAGAMIIGQDCYRMVSEVVAMGIPREVVLEHSGSLRPDDNDTVATAVRGRQNRMTSTDIPSEALQYVRYIEVIVRLDRDQDGIAEKYRAIMLGDGPEPIALLPGDDCQFIVSSPYRRPHEPIGNGAVEEAIDLQDQMTALVRGWINNMNRANEPREIVSSSDMIGYESLKSPYAGPIRSDAPQAIGIHVIPFTANQNLPLLQYFEARSASRFGITPASQGLDPDVLKGQTAQGADVIVSAPQVALEFLAREYAAGVMKPLFQAMLNIAKRYQDQKAVIRLRGKWVEMDPRDWPADMDVDVRVGLGSGTKQDRLIGLLAIMAKQTELMSMGSPLVGPEQQAEALRTFTELQGYKDTSRFFVEMSEEELAAAVEQSAQAQKQQALEAIQLQVQAEAAKAAAVQAEKSKGEVEKAKVDAMLAYKVAQEKQAGDVQIAQAKTGADLTLGREKLKSDAKLTLEQTLMQLTVQEHGIAAKERVDMANAAFDHEAKLLELQMERELEQMKIRAQVGSHQGELKTKTKR
jgi:hypothetical protein